MRFQSGDLSALLLSQIFPYVKILFSE